MTKLKPTINKSQIMRELEEEARIKFKNCWQSRMHIDAYLMGVKDLLEKLQLKKGEGYGTNYM